MQMILDPAACSSAAYRAKPSLLACHSKPHRRRLPSAASQRPSVDWRRAAGSDRSSSAPDLRDEEPSTSGREEEAQQPAFPAKWLTLLGGLGVAETGYLFLSKVFSAPVACPVSGSCDSVLNSDYSTVFGVPLALLGLLGYGAVAGLGALTWAQSQQPQAWQKRAALAGASVLAACSSYLVYILTTEFPGDVCVWCLGSAATSLAILITAVRGLSTRDLSQGALPSGAAALAVYLGLSVAWQGASGPGALADIDIAFREPVIRNQSSPQAVQLAKRLKDAGAKMYGAFWCSHCQEQKMEFGAGAQSDLPYVECYPEGYHKGTKINPACAAANLQGFPSWIINGKEYSGAQTFEQLEAALAK